MASHAQILMQKHQKYEKKKAAWHLPKSIIHSNDSEVDEISDKEFKRMINTIEDTNKHLNELKENQLNEIRKAMEKWKWKSIKI
jgi:ribosomal 50S subunit-associated protein YjgA (DUF615 family)